MYSSWNRRNETAPEQVLAPVARTVAEVGKKRENWEATRRAVDLQPCNKRLYWSTILLTRS